MVGVKLLGINPGVYIGRIHRLRPVATYQRACKSVMFGLITTLVVSYHGFYTTGAPRGGQAATSSVVWEASHSRL